MSEAQDPFKTPEDIYFPADLFVHESIKGALIVSRETEIKLRRYAALVFEWGQKFNLVAPSTLPQLGVRHILDSAQLYPLLPPDIKILADMGSGAGFPGVVLSILGVPEVHLIESIGKKAGFLRHVAQELGLNITVHQARVESLRDLKVDVVTARALTALPLLLSYAKPLLRPDGFCLFLKGQNVDAELTAAQKYWTFDCTKSPSVTDDSGAILQISNLRILHPHGRKKISGNKGL